ncbi:hypothetical protein ABPG74_000710 [Tetrahymena malaccensis]
MEDSIYESLSFREEQEKIKQRISFQTQNIQKGYSVEDLILTKNLDCSILSQVSHLQQDQNMDSTQNKQQIIVNSISEQQKPVDIQLLNDNDILQMSPNQFSSSRDKDITFSNLKAEKNDQNIKRAQTSQFKLQQDQFEDSTKNQFFSPNNNNIKSIFKKNNISFSDACQPKNSQSLQSKVEISKMQNALTNQYKKEHIKKPKQVFNKFADINSKGNISSGYFNSNLYVNLKRYLIILLFQDYIFGKSYQEFLEGKYLFSLDTLPMQIWDIFSIVFTLSLIVFIPIMHLLAFQESKIWQIFHDQVITWLLLFEVLLSLNTEIYQNGVTIRDRRQIFRLNSNKLMSDFIILVVYSLSIKQNKQKIEYLQYLDYVTFLKYLNIPRKVSQFENKLQISDSIKNWMKLIKLELLIIILVHVASSNFLKIGLENSERGQISWITKNEINYESMWDLYFLSVYFIIITICTIGYGDIYPCQLNEKLFIAFVSVLATNFIAYTFSQISEIVKFESSKNQKFNDFMTDINNQMKTIGLSMSLSVKVRKHFEFAYYQEEQKQLISEFIIDKLPNSLKNQVLIEVYHDKINSIKMFKEFSPDCLKNLLLSFKQKQLYPDEILVNQQENSENLYFLISGDLEINFQIRETKYGKIYEKSNQKIHKSDVFGYEGFLLGQSSPYQLKSIGPSLVSYIDKSSFLQILKEYPEDQEKFFCIRDSAIFGLKSSSFKFSECISCGRFSHTISNCPYLSLNITYKPCKENNTRNKSFFRKRERQRNALKNMIYIQQMIKKIQINNNESDITDAYNIFLNLLDSSDESQTESSSDFSQSNLSNQKSSDKVNSFKFKSNQILSPKGCELPKKQAASLQFLNQKQQISSDSDSQGQKNFVKSISLKLYKNNQPNQINQEINQNNLVYDQESQNKVDFNLKQNRIDYQNDQSISKISNKSIMLTEDVYAEFNDSNQNQEKNNAFRKLGNSDEHLPHNQSSSLQKFLNVNTVQIQQRHNYFQDQDTNLLNQQFLKKKKRFEQHSNKFQRSLTADGFKKKKSSNFCKKKQSLIMLDILMNMGDKKLKLLQNRIDNTQDKQYLNNLIELALNMPKRHSGNILLNKNRNENQQIINQNFKQEEEEQNENFTEFLIRKKVGLQDLDMLVEDNYNQRRTHELIYPGLIKKKSKKYKKSQIYYYFSLNFMTQDQKRARLERFIARIKQNEVAEFEFNDNVILPPYDDQGNQQGKWLTTKYKFGEWYYDMNGNPVFISPDDEYDQNGSLFDADSNPYLDYSYDKFGNPCPVILMTKENEYFLFTPQFEIQIHTNLTNKKEPIFQKSNIKVNKDQKTQQKYEQNAQEIAKLERQETKFKKNQVEKESKIDNSIILPPYDDQGNKQGKWLTTKYEYGEWYYDMNGNPVFISPDENDQNVILYDADIYPYLDYNFDKLGYPCPVILMTQEYEYFLFTPSLEIQKPTKLIKKEKQNQLHTDEEIAKKLAKLDRLRAKLKKNEVKQESKLVKLERF